MDLREAMKQAVNAHSIPPFSVRVNSALMSGASYVHDDFNNYFKYLKYAQMAPHSNLRSTSPDYLSRPGRPPEAALRGEAVSRSHRHPLHPSPLKRLLQHSLRG